MTTYTAVIELGESGPVAVVYDDESGGPVTGSFPLPDPDGPPSDARAAEFESGAIRVLAENGWRVDYWDVAGRAYVAEAERI
jgi:hypothetical protein